MSKKGNARDHSFENHRLRAMMWLVNLLQKHKEGLDLSKIQEYWLDKNNADLNGGNPLERRTMYNYINGIQDLFEVIIEYDNRARKYKIVAQDDRSKISQWLLKSFSVSHAISANKDISNRIVLEDIPSGTELLDPLLEAIRTNSRISFKYQRFDDFTPRPIKAAEPYCLKLYRQRWYLLVKEYQTLLVSHEKIATMDVLSLDRMSELEILSENFELDPLFDAQEYFKYAFGTRVYKDNPPQRVLLKVEAGQACYIRTLPLHHSQKEIERNKEYSIFELNVALTRELYQGILDYGHTVEVLESTELKDIICNEICNMAELYGIIEPLPPMTEEEIEEDMKNHPEKYEEKHSQDLYQGIFHGE